MATIKRVQGNRLELAIPLQTVTMTPNGKVTEDYNVPADAEVKVVLSSSWKTYGFEPISISGNVVTMRDDGKLPAGKYAVEVRIRQADGTPLRSKYCNIIDIRDCNDGVTQEYDDFIEGSVTLDAQIFWFAKGDDGITPHIDETTGNWFIGDEDTGVHAQGEAGTTDYNELDNKPDLSIYVEKDGDKVLSDNNYTTEEKTKLAGLENYDDTNVLNLIEQTNQNFANYYTKQQTYSQSEVNSLLEAQRQGEFVSVLTLPEASPLTMFKIYLVPKADAEEGNERDEYITIQQMSRKPSGQTVVTYKWELIGDTKCDLSGYSTTEEMNAAIQQALASYYTKTEADALLGGKQDRPFVIEVNNGDTTVPSGTYASITTALAEGREVMVKYNDGSECVYYLPFVRNDDGCYFSGIVEDYSVYVSVYYDETINIYSIGLQGRIDSTHKLDVDLVADGTKNKVFTATEKIKLSGIESGAQVNVKPDWNAASGNDAEILNKPTIPAVPTISTDIDTDGNDDTKTASPKAVKTFVEGKGYLTQHQDISGKQDTLVSGTNIKTINNESVLGSGNITIQGGGGSQVQSDWNQSDNTAVDYIKNKPTIPVIPSNLAYTSNDNGEGIVPSDGIRAVTVTSAATMTINPDVVTVIDGAVGTAAITLQVPQDNLAHVWDILMTTDSTVAITFAMSNSETILTPSGFSIGASKAVEISVIGVGTKYYLRYGEFA